MTVRTRVDGDIRAFTNDSAERPASAEQQRELQDALAQVVRILNNLSNDHVRGSLVISILATFCLNRSNPVESAEHVINKAIRHIAMNLAEGGRA